MTNSLLTSNLRCVKIFNSQLYVSSGSGTGVGVSIIGSGLPTNGTPTTTLIIPDGGTSPSPYNFEINPATNICYVADDRANASGGILKYTNSGSAWSLSYTLPTTGTANIGARSLAVDWSGPSPVIYATTAEASMNRIIKIVDTESAATAVTLATAPVNTAFRGLAFTPANSLVPPTIISQTILGNGSFQFVFSEPNGQTYRLLASTDMTLPIASWTVVSSGTFGTGPITYTESSGLPQRFYIIVSP